MRTAPPDYLPDAAEVWKVHYRARRRPESCFGQHYAYACFQNPSLSFSISGEWEKQKPFMILLRPTMKISTTAPFLLPRKNHPTNRLANHNIHFLENRFILLSASLPVRC